MKEIKLHGKFSFRKFAFVDDEDFEEVNKYRWIAQRGGNNWYASARINKKSVLMHRFIINPPANMCIDHINHNSLDNTKSNLRICSHAENMRNRQKHKNTSSSFIGVHSTHKNKWMAKIEYMGKVYKLGVFDTEEDAAIARDKKAIEFDDKFISLNFPTK